MSEKNDRYGRALSCATVICVLAILAMILSLILTGRRSAQEEFAPPPFESAAQSGMPDVADESWIQVYKDGMSFSAHICGSLILNGKAADVYFTNDAGNEVWLKLRILDEEGNIIAETGLLRPNEYIQTVTFDTAPTQGEAVSFKIMAYEPDTYYSAGAVTLHTTAAFAAIDAVN